MQYSAKREPVISVNNLEKSYRGSAAVKDVSFEIQAGECVAILGPNGAGKTTTINILLGLRRYDGGSVRVFGDAPLSMRARRLIGVTQQNNGLPSTMNVSEVLAYVAALHGDAVPVSALIERFGLERVARRQVAGLSGGEQRRLSLALAFAGKPQLVILDEPTTGLDVEGRRAVWQAIGESSKAGTTVLLTTHYLQEAEALASRAIVISRGRILTDGPMAEIRANSGARKVSFISDSVPAGIAGATVAGNRYSIITTDPDAIVRELFSNKIAYRDLEIVAPSLEDVFLRMVGEAS